MLKVSLNWSWGAGGLEVKAEDRKTAELCVEHCKPIEIRTDVVAITYPSSGSRAEKDR